jgi:hypothetical protein
MSKIEDDIEARLAQEPKTTRAQSQATAPKIARISSKDPDVMTAGEINKELDKLEEQNSKLTQRMIDAGRGYERPSEYLRMTDPLSMKLRKNSDRRMILRIQIERRYGPGAPRRLPREFGPVRPTRGT